MIKIEEPLMVGLFHLFFPSLLSLLFLLDFSTFGLGVELVSLVGGQGGEMALLGPLSAKQ